MPSPSSSEPTVQREKPLLSFLLVVSLVVGSFYIVRKYFGVLVALIVAYLVYVYRDELKSEIGELVPHEEPARHDRT